MSAIKEQRFVIDGRKIVATFVEVNDRVFVNRICQIVKRPRAYGEVQRKIWPRAVPGTVARAALEYLNASDNGLTAAVSLVLAARGQK
jgi:hypothetical protein